MNAGITHDFSCISTCQVPRKQFKDEDSRLSGQTSPEGPGKCKCNDNMCDHCSENTAKARIYLLDDLWEKLQI